MLGFIKGLFALLGVIVLIPVGIFMIFLIYSFNAIETTTSPEIGSRYSSYAMIEDVKRLKWINGMYTGCAYTRIRWSDNDYFKLSDSVNQNGSNGLQLGANEIWYAKWGKWDRGPINKRRPSAYWSGQVANCSTTKFGRVSNVYKKIFKSDVWFIDTRKMLIVVSNDDKTIEILSETN